MEMITDDIARMLCSIRLEVNAQKSKFLEISDKGEVIKIDLKVEECGLIPAVSADEKVEYLGVKFQYDLKFNLHEEITEFSSKIDSLMANEALFPDQKLTLLKDYLWPTIIYKLQTSPRQSCLLPDLKKLDDIVKLFAQHCESLLIRKWICVSGLRMEKH